MRLNRKAKWTLIALSVALVVFGGYVYFLGTRALLAQAEAFAFRRMIVPQLEEAGSFRFFYATNRTLADPLAPADKRFHSQRQSGLIFGSFDTSIEPSLGLGMLIDPSEWFLNEEIQLSNVVDLNREDMLTRIRAQVSASPHRSLLVVVHGFREQFPSALRKTAFLAHVLDINTPVLVFDWPGDQGSSIRGYRRARSVAQESAAELAVILKGVVNEVGPDRIWLLANSMGAQVVVNAFDVLHQDPDFADAENEFENVILTAPDVGQEEFNQRFREESWAMAENVTVYVSSNDRALLASRLLNMRQRLGESTLDPGNPGLVRQAHEFAMLLSPGDERLVLVDVTPVNRTRNFHNFSLEVPEFFDDLFLRLTRRDLPETRDVYFLETPQGQKYFVLTRGR